MKREKRETIKLAMIMKAAQEDRGKSERKRGKGERRKKSRKGAMRKIRKRGEELKRNRQTKDSASY